MQKFSLEETESIIKYATADAKKQESERWKDILADIITDIDSLKYKVGEMTAIDVKDALDKIASKGYMEMGRE